jgi:hypothetical protein
MNSILNDITEVFLARPLLFSCFGIAILLCLVILFITHHNQQVQEQVEARNRAFVTADVPEKEMKRKLHDDMITHTDRMREAGSSEEEIELVWRDFYVRTRTPLGPAQIFTIFDMVITYEISDPDDQDAVEDKLREILTTNRKADLARYESILNIRILSIDSPPAEPRKIVKGFMG